MYVEKTTMLSRLVSLLYFSQRAYIDLFIAGIERNETQNASKHCPLYLSASDFVFHPFRVLAGRGDRFLLK